MTKSCSTWFHVVIFFRGLLCFSLFFRRGWGFSWGGVECRRVVWSHEIHACPCSVDADAVRWCLCLTWRFTLLWFVVFVSLAVYVIGCRHGKKPVTRYFILMSVLASYVCEQSCTSLRWTRTDLEMKMEIVTQWFFALLYLGCHALSLSPIVRQFRHDFILSVISLISSLWDGHICINPE